MSTSDKNQQISKQISPAELLSKLKMNIDSWSDAVERFIEVAKVHNEYDEKQQKEIENLSRFLEGPLRKRLTAVFEGKSELKDRYTNFLEPFYTEDGLRNFIEHHFSVTFNRSENQLIYREKERYEKEVGILFLLFKVKKTIESINTLQKTIDSGEVFPCSFSSEKQLEHLKILKEILKLFFIKFIKKEHLKAIYSRLSEKQLDTRVMLKKREANISYVKDKILDGTEVRDLFVLLFYSLEMRTTKNKKDVNIKFNYLDFELIKNEFLIDWMQRKLKGNKNKEKIYNKYKIEGKTISELVKKNPKKEPEILQKIPLEVFNDIAEKVNELVEEKDKAPISTSSKNHGEIAKIDSMFNRAKKLASVSFDKIKKMITDKMRQKTAPQTNVSKPDYSLSTLTKHDIDFGFFDEDHSSYDHKLGHLKKKMGQEQHQLFQNELWDFFGKIETDQLVKRDEPVKEWTVPFLIADGEKTCLLIIGAKISQAKSKGGLRSSNYNFNPYFVYGFNTKEDETYGNLLNKRKVHGSNFYCYSYVEDKVQEEVMNFFQQVILQEHSPIFKKSDLKFTAKKDQGNTASLIKNDYAEQAETPI
ncbi:MAG: hypothetical protein GY786_19080 [Proteobacteria bacterium]|nr:hypothetical protein [Pseudomonadota bacterium]